MKQNLTAAFVLSSILLANGARADEPFAPKEFWLARGMHKVEQRRSPSARSEATPPWAEHSLAWPVTFQDKQHSIGNSMLEFQSYGDGPYYHGGCDLRVARKAPVFATVNGSIEAGHYGYTNNADGSMDKYWQPWPQDGDSTYFEIAIVTPEGYRFEFHHMDETNISAGVLSILRAGGGKISTGALLGNTIAWPGGDYHHTHYNIISPTGARLNPEFFSPVVPDSQAPKVSAIFAVFTDGSTQDFGNGTFSRRPDFFAAAVIDHNDDNVYDHPPVSASIVFEDGNNYQWDFREFLLGPDGKFPSIWTFFVESIDGPNGHTYATEGGYGEGQSIVKIPVPTKAQGKFRIAISDQANNAQTYNGTVDAAF